MVLRGWRRAHRHAMYPEGEDANNGLVMQHQNHRSPGVFQFANLPGKPPPQAAFPPRKSEYVRR